MEQVIGKAITQQDRELAQVCIECTACKSAREKQADWAYWFVKLQRRGCAYCQAYEKVYGRKAYEKGL